MTFKRSISEGAALLRCTAAAAVMLDAHPAVLSNMSTSAKRSPARPRANSDGLEDVADDDVNRFGREKLAFFGLRPRSGDGPGEEIRSEPPMSSGGTDRDVEALTIE
jgi:hypothetical protein